MSVFIKRPKCSRNDIFIHNSNAITIQKRNKKQSKSRQTQIEFQPLTDTGGNVA